MDPIETLIVNTLTGTVGTPLAIGAIGLLFFIILGVAFRLSIFGFLVMLLPLIFIFAAYGILPHSILYGLLIVCAYVIYMAIMVVLRR